MRRRSPRFAVRACAPPTVSHPVSEVPESDPDPTPGVLAEISQAQPQRPDSMVSMLNHELLSEVLRWCVRCGGDVLHVSRVCQAFGFSMRLLLQQPDPEFLELLWQAHWDSWHEDRESQGSWLQNLINLTPDPLVNEEDMKYFLEIQGSDSGTSRVGRSWPRRTAPGGQPLLLEELHKSGQHYYTKAALTLNGRESRQPGTRSCEVVMKNTGAGRGHIMGWFLPLGWRLQVSADCKWESVPFGTDVYLKLSGPMSEGEHGLRCDGSFARVRRVAAGQTFQARRFSRGEPKELKEIVTRDGDIELSFHISCLDSPVVGLACHLMRLKLDGERPYPPLWLDRKWGQWLQDTGAVAGAAATSAADLGGDSSGNGDAADEESDEESDDDLHYGTD